MNTSEILIYQAADGKIKIDVRLEDETVWLTQDHMAGLFGKSKKTISEHIRNIFSEGELDEQAGCPNFPEQPLDMAPCLTKPNPETSILQPWT